MNNSGPQPRRQLSLVDAVAIIIGIVIGTGLYEATPQVAVRAPSVAALAGFWLAGGLFALVGALCYAELATAWPAEGGDYVFLTRAFGRWLGLLFAWCQFWVVRPGSIGAMAFVFGRYAAQLAPLGDWSFALYACGSIVVLSLINIVGVRQGVWTQNVLSAAKIVGLLAVVGIGWLGPAAEVSPAPAAPVDWSLGSVQLAMILVLFAYGGWNDLAYVAAEVRNPQHNILRSLVLGVLAIATIYLLVNLAMVRGLGLSGMRASQAVAADVVTPTLGAWGGQAVSLLVCVSALGAINGMLFTGARIYYALGQEHRLFAPLGVWNRRLETPVRALLAQMLLTLAVVLGFAWLAGNDRAFFRLVNFTAPLFWMFLTLSGGALFVLRWREPDHPRPFRVPWYPLLPALFCLQAGFMIYAGVSYAWSQRSPEALWTIGSLAVGLVLVIVEVWRGD